MQSLPIILECRPFIYSYRKHFLKKISCDDILEQLMKNSGLCVLHLVQHAIILINIFDSKRD